MPLLFFSASAKGKQSTKASGAKKSKSSKTAKKVSGLKRNLVPEKIVGAKKFEKGIVYLVKWLVSCFFECFCVCIYLTVNSINRQMHYCCFQVVVLVFNRKKNIF